MSFGFYKHSRNKKVGFRPLLKLDTLITVYNSQEGFFLRCPLEASSEGIEPAIESRIGAFLRGGEFLQCLPKLSHFRFRLVLPLLYLHQHPHAGFQEILEATDLAIRSISANFRALLASGHVRQVLDDKFHPAFDVHAAGSQIITSVLTSPSC
ncbi:MAG TPA: hypothetical protein VK419_08825 [Bryobacteraceae bacterium]|nr:hypothetical protein [Bryobacteraceae bacterium]